MESVYSSECDLDIAQWRSSPSLYRSSVSRINDTGPRSGKGIYQDTLFDVGLRGEMGVWRLFRRGTGNLVSVTRGTRGRAVHWGGSQPALRNALLDTDPATAFNPFLNFNAHNTKAARQRVYVTLSGIGEFQLPLGYFTTNGDLFNLPAGPVSFALGGEYHGERFTMTVTRSITRLARLAQPMGKASR